MIFHGSERFFMLYRGILGETHELERVFMVRAPQLEFSGPVTIFHDRRLPEQAVPVGYAALIDALHLRVPLPRILSAVGPRHKQYKQDGWNIYTPASCPCRRSGQPSYLCTQV